MAKESEKLKVRTNWMNEGKNNFTQSPLLTINLPYEIKDTIVEEINSGLE